MAKILNSEDLIKSLKRRALIPTNQNTFTDEDFLDILNEEMDIGILPHVLKIHEEYFVYSIDVPLESEKTRYEIPYRAIGNKLRDLAFVDTAGSVYELSRISLEEVSDYETYSSITNKNVFYVENTEIVLPNRLFQQSGSLRFHYYLRPSSLVESSLTATITDIDRTNGIITMDSFPSEFSNLPDLDFVAHKSPNAILEYDITSTESNKNARTITVDPASIPDKLQIGDHVCEKEQTPVPQLPSELHSLLAQRAAVHCLEAMGDTEGLSNALKKLKEMETNTWTLIDDRVEGAPQKIQSRNGPIRESLGKKRRRSIF